VDQNNNHYVTIYNIQRQKQLLHMESSKDAVMGIQWSKRANDLRFATWSSKEMNFWHPADVTKKLKQKGIFEKFSQEKIACADFDEEGWCYSGNENGSVYVWSDACKVVKSLKVHAKEITCLSSAGGKILTGAKDNKVGIITATGGNFKLEKFVEIATMPKSLDFLNGNLLAGLRNG
jgi:WD40 repeat protein